MLNFEFMYIKYLINLEINLSNCQLFLNGALTYGLKQYNYLLS